MLAEILVGIILIELMVYLAVKIVYWYEYTKAYLHSETVSMTLEELMEMMDDDR